ncbi:MAG: DUF882 domain-containing protein, partial [Hyphomicrobiaceae bacterium]|nr:DUF882 domain-containing protein [Hyphomicrobiaceae bacterium]
AHDKLNWFLRDWRRDEPTKMDPALFDIIWELRTELGTREPTHVISGYRSPGTNEMLRKSVGGQARNSQHTHGRAMDIHFPDVPVKRLRYSALIRERGGVGYYPTSALPFVHVDTGNVRHWPKMPRYELALLFPNGRTKHVPADGRALSPGDVAVARTKHNDLAIELAAFHDSRRAPRAPAPTLVAERGPSAPTRQVAALAAPSPPQSQPTARATPPQPSVPSAGAPMAPPPIPTPQPTRAGPPPGSLQVASLSPVALPSLTPPQPRIAERPSRFSTGPSESERAKLTDMFRLASLFGSEPAQSAVDASARPSGGAAVPPSLTGAVAALVPPPAAHEAEAALTARDDDQDAAARLGWGNGFASAPEFDEEHPDELFYRPFPLAPLLTATASPDDPALARMWEPDVVATLELLDDELVALPMAFAAGRRGDEVVWAQQFRGPAVQMPPRTAEPAAEDVAGLERRRVRTSVR